MSVLLNIMLNDEMPLALLSSDDAEPRRRLASSQVFRITSIMQSCSFEVLLWLHNVDTVE